ncbi:MAG TPA: hypothetical protein VFA43_00415 [Gemmatimonadaceae bacterium]|nr:hypothetical protein [Gemmatimonadaceae bacterium]
MTKRETLVVNLVIALGVGALIASVVIGARAPQTSPGIFNPSVRCPNATLASIDSVDPDTISALKQGVHGLPCDATIEQHRTSLTAGLQHEFDYYSWLTFIALNSPADSMKRIGADAPTVWETWKQLPDVMREGAAEPTPWGQPDAVPSECHAASGERIVHMELEETYNEPFKSGPLFDQHGNYALFVILMNQQMFRYIVDNTLYSRAGQQRFDGNINFPNGNDSASTLGAVMIKASWRILTPGVDYDPSGATPPRYHMTDALLFRPAAQTKCQPVKLGLIGFHVGHKTRSRQQWIWTTFEHHDNVPTRSDVDSGRTKGRRYSFYDPACPSCAINQTPPGPWDPDRLQPAWDPVQHSSQFKSQIVRTGPAAGPAFDGVDKLNRAFHKWLGTSVWSHYDLITTQWPSGHCANDTLPGRLPDATCAPFPAYLANTTLETFSQSPNDAGVPQATSSCIACHNNATTLHVPARRSDFTYILEKAK